MFRPARSAALILFRCRVLGAAAQARLVWAFSELSTISPDRDHLLDLAEAGVRFLAERFLDREHGGWFWKVTRDGVVIDDAKLTYGQSFALYAMACHARHTGDERTTDLAVATFDVLRSRAHDDEHGGYRENMDRAWTSVSDRKSLDVHMHLLESFAELVRLTGYAVHAAALREVRSLVVETMVDRTTGAGGNQYSASFEPLLPVVIPKTWIAERPVAEQPEPAAQLTTSFGHNLELAWLLAVGCWPMPTPPCR